MDNQTKNSGKIEGLLKIMAKLRDPDDGCPWDVKQTFATIVPHTIEEAYEVADAIDSNDMASLKDELGDLLFQVVFYAQMAKEAGEFDFNDVVTAISEKMVRRHPHVFAGAVFDNQEQQLESWEAIKRQEKFDKGQIPDDKKKESALDGVISALPALSRAYKLQKRAARAGFDWDTLAPVIGKVREELEEVEAEIELGNRERLEDELGDLLFCCVNLARKLDIDPETALRGGNAKFERRFLRMEALMDADNEGFSSMRVADVLDIYWTQAKSDEC
jgi:ATP diphosphatase